MSPHRIAFLAARILAVLFLGMAILKTEPLLFLIFTGIPLRPSNWDSEYLLLLLFYALPVVALLVMTGLLWFKADRVGQWFCAGLPASTDDASASGTEARDATMDAAAWLTITCAGVGLYVIAMAIPQMVTHVHYTLVDYGQAQTEGLSPVIDVMRFAPSLVQVALGLWLTLGGRGISRFIVNLRSAGVKS